MPYNNKKLKILCEEAKIETFYECVIQLSEVWFGESSHTSITSAMEKYILHGGTYGTKIITLLWNRQNRVVDTPDISKVAFLCRIKL